MHKPQEQVREFHNAAGLRSTSFPGLRRLPFDREILRFDLISEELEELAEALDHRDLVGQADALGDLLYVVYGFAEELGFNMEPIFDEIHRSNMTKVGPDSKVKKREDGKILKPESYEPPNLEPIVKAQCLLFQNEY